MLACPQDIFFHNDSNNNNNGMNKYMLHDNNNMQSDYQHKDKRIRHQQLRKDQMMNANDMSDSNGDDLLDNSVITNNIKDKEEVTFFSCITSVFFF